MTRIDYHIHTKLCRHATGEMEDYVQVALAKQFEEIGFSDHFPMIYLPITLDPNDYCMTEAEVPLYIQSVKELQKQYSTDIRIKLGVEVDFCLGKEKVIKKLLQPFKFDYIYGSVHLVDGWIIDDDRNKAKYQNYDLFELYKTYFSLQKKAIETGLFDILTHFDLPKKFGFRPQQSIAELTDEIVEALVKQKMAVELNTAGLRKPVKECYPSTAILKKCYERDIPVTFGSDSHKPEEVGWEIERGLSILREIGYSQVVGFQNRKKVFYEI
ncbi:MAG: histidinol-phosphatase HisJ [Candidatus Helarchaeota archaeon]|nr:histidinol-phosphatase HisJ [Candidatus Helarchaeota archaeon]